MASFDVTEGNIIQLTLKGEYPAGNAMLNVFNYRLSDAVFAPGGLENDAQSFAAGLWVAMRAELRAFTINNANYNSIKVDEYQVDGTLVNNTEWPIPTADRAGLVGGEGYYSGVCYTFRYNRPSAQFRLGYKRFGAASENNIGASNTIPGATRTLLDALAAVLSLDIDSVNPDDLSTFGTPAVMEPVLIRKVVNGDPLVPWLVGRTTGVVFSKLGTQNSRKPGYGI